MEAQTVMRVDATVEASLGVALLAGFGAHDFPHPVGRGAVLAVGVALVVVGVAVWSGRIGLRALVAGNVVTAAAAVAWLAAPAHFSTSGAALLAAAAAALVVLAAWEVATLGP